MLGSLYSLKKLFIYEKPSQYDMEKGFELLEDENEGREYIDEKLIDSQKNTHNGVNSHKDSSDEDHNTGKIPRKAKVPMTVEEWNKNKNSDVPGRVSSSLNDNREAVNRLFGLPENQDIIVREFVVARKFEAFIVYVDGMADKNTINHYVLPQLMDKQKFEDFSGKCPVDYIAKNVISINQLTKLNDYEKINKQILNGLTALFIDGCEDGLVLETRGYEKRNIDNPKTEAVVKGSQEAFTENLRTNLTLIRRIVKNEKLITETLPIGKTNNSSCALLYLNGIANPKVIREVKERIKSIGSGYIIGDGMLEQFIEDNPWNLLPHILSTERPDRAASFIMSGQVVIVMDGTPFVLCMPVTFWALFHTSEDNNLLWRYGTFIRLIRVLGLLLAVLLPGLYLSLELYHPEMIPTTLLATIEKARENVPFPAVVEILMMEISFELIREGGLRVPGLIGQTLGIVGALILGQAAVAAGLVSPMLIIIVAITGLGSFTIPNYELGIGIRMLRFIYILGGAIAGFFGVAVAFTITIGLACSLKSFGVPYFSPIAPKTKVNPDVIIAKPIFRLKNRPDYLNTPNRRQQPDISRGWAFKKSNRKGEDKG